jgi:hypothetical protein
VRPVFKPSVVELTPRLAGDVPGLEEALSYWGEGEQSAEGWIEELLGEWGRVGFVMRNGGVISGCIVYAPASYLPLALRYPLSSLRVEDVLLAHLFGDRRSKKHLLVQAMRELRLTGVGSLEAIASDLGLSHHTSSVFLFENGFRPVEHTFYRGLPYTLARVELGNTVGVDGLARGLISRVKIPALHPPVPSPESPARTAGGYRVLNREIEDTRATAR